MQANETTNPIPYNKTEEGSFGWKDAWDIAKENQPTPLVDTIISTFEFLE